MQKRGPDGGKAGGDVEYEWHIKRLVNPDP